MFILNGSHLAQGTAFTVNDIQYPANWLNLTTLAEKLAIGITEVADPVRADDRFYWDGDVNNPKDLSKCQAMLITQVKTAAGSLLSVTDWKVIRAAEGGAAVDADTTAKRTAIRTKSNEIEAAITACTTVEQLASLDLSFPKQD
jgi:hypothetical protein